MSSTNTPSEVHMRPAAALSRLEIAPSGAATVKKNVGNARTTAAAFPHARRGTQSLASGRGRCGRPVGMMRSGALMLGFALSLGAGELRIGRAAVKITPPAGIPMAGYYSIRLAEGAHNDLYCKAIVVEKDGSLAALVACDLVSIDSAIVGEARQLAAKLTPIRPDWIMISATHTHTGPLLNPRLFAAAEAVPRRIAEQYRGGLPARIAETIKQAHASLASARVLTATGHESSISFYRRFLMKDGTVRTNPGKRNPEIVQPMGEIDPEVDLVWFQAPADGRPMAAYVNFALHPDTTGGVQFSADYPHTLAKILGKLHGPDLLTLFSNGAAGNIN